MTAPKPSTTRPRPGPPQGWAYTPTTDTDWQKQAACRDLDDPDAVLYPEPHVRVAGETHWDAGRELCQACPVQAQCLDWALTTGESYGMWGGTTERERAELRSRLGLRTPQRREVPMLTGVPHDGEPHGTRAAYQRHRRRGEDACVPCLEAHAAYFRQAPPAGKRGKRLPRSEIIIQREAG